MNDLNALEQAARGIRDGTLVYDYPTFQLLIAAVRGADALRARLPDAWTLAQWFHEEYERVAPTYGYETRAESRTTFDEVPQANRLTMVATAQAVLDRIAALSPTEPAE